MTTYEIRSPQHRPIALRNGRPAYENAPEPIKAAVPMREWLKRHQENRV